MDARAHATSAFLPLRPLQFPFTHSGDSSFRSKTQSLPDPQIAVQANRVFRFNLDPSRIDRLALQYRTILFVANSKRTRTSRARLQNSERALPHRLFLQSGLSALPHRPLSDSRPPSRLAVC